MQKQIKRLRESEESSAAERLERRFQDVMETLHDGDFEIIEYDGQTYDAGMTLRVLQFEPRENIERETIVETVRPSMRLRGFFVPGEVVVATPIAKPTNVANEDQS